MKLNMDCIQFECRAEVDNILRALYEHRKTHRKDDVVEELIAHLEYMQMCW